MSPVNVTSPCSVSMRTLFRSSCLALGVLKRALPPSHFPNLKEGRKMTPPPPPAFPPNVAQKERENFIAMIQKSVLFGSRSVLIADNQSQIKKERKFAGSGFATFSQLFSHLGQRKSITLPKKKRRNRSQFQGVTVSLLSCSTNCDKRNAARIVFCVSQQLLLSLFLRARKSDFFLFLFISLSLL